MSLRLMTGVKGSGKTCLTTAMLCESYQKGRGIYANYALKFPYTPLDMEDIVENMENLQDVAIAIDEAQIYFDCRMSASKQNRLFSYLMLQSRKRNVDILMTSQQLWNVDVRIRRNLDYLSECVAMVEKAPGKFRRATVEEIEGRRVDRVFVRETNYAQESSRSFLFNPTPYFTLYNSDEICSITTG